MTGELTWKKKAAVHEVALENAHAKLFDAQCDRDVWRLVLSSLKVPVGAKESDAGKPQRAYAQQQLLNLATTILYCTRAIEYHTRCLAEATREAEKESDEEELDDI